MAVVHAARTKSVVVVVVLSLEEDDDDDDERVIISRRLRAMDQWPQAVAVMVVTLS
jgi:hypothetical protein